VTGVENSNSLLLFSTPVLSFQGRKNYAVQRKMLRWNGHYSIVQYTLWRCPSVCSSQAGVLFYQNGWIDQAGSPHTVFHQQRINPILLWRELGVSRTKSTYFTAELSRTRQLSRVFSESEFTFKFAICCRPSVCRLSAGNARAPYSGGWNFRQYFYDIWYLGYPLISTENFTEIVPGNPSAGGVKDKRSSQV